MPLFNLENVLGYLGRNETLGALFHARKDEIVTDRGSRIRIVSSDAPSAYGLGGTHRRFRVICDELTTWIAWSSVGAWMMVSTGPNTSSWAMSISGVTSSRMVGPR